MDNIYNSQRKVWLAFGLTVLFMLFFSFFAQAQWTQQGADIDGEANNNNFGVSVSFSSNGTKVAIGAPYNAGGGTSRGRVRIYAWSGSAWVQQGGNIDGEADFDESGVSVSMSADGNKVAIGAQYNAGGGFESGHVRVYTWNGTAWVQQGADINGEAASDRSGSAIALSGDGTRLIIGAQLNTGGSGGSNRGHARVYAWSGSAWVQQGADINGEADGDESGRAVAISSDGSKVIIGAHYNTAGAGVFADRGHARVYSWSGSAWVQQGADIDGVANGNLAGSAVAISSDGSKIAVGAPNNAGGGTARGHVRVFTWSGSAWVQQGTNLNGEGDNNGFGTAISFSSNGGRLAVGAPYNAGVGTNAGHVRVFEWSGSAWGQVSTDIDAESAGNRAGFAVSLTSDGTKVAIGAPFNPAGGTNRGHVRVYGSAVATPTIVSSGSLSALSTVYGTASSNTSFNVSGTNMTAGILVTPPAGFEVSLSAGSGFGSSVTVGSAGTIASTTVYVRLSAVAIPNTYSGNIALSSAGATNVNVATVASTVSAKDLTITGVTANNKIYNANTTATLSGSPTLVGIVSGDIVTLDVSAVTAFFNNKNVGTAKPVNTFNYALTGANAGNYTLTQPVLSADITAKTLTVSGATASSKIYDGNTVATLGGSPTFVGVAGFDAIGMTYNTASAVGTFADKNVGVGKTVTTSGYSIGGANAGNYTVTQPILSADITPKTLTITGITANSRIYNANFSATVSGSPTLVGVLGGDDVTVDASSATASFTDKHVGTAKVVNTFNYVLIDVDAGNYTLTQPVLSADITPKTLTVSGATASSKIYDGNTVATLGGSPTFVGVVGFDAIGMTFNTASAVGAFADKNVGVGKTVTTSGYSIGGANAGNYTVTQPTLTANITKKMLVTNSSANNKVYDNTNTATLFSAITSGIVGSESVSINIAGVFSSVSAGNNIPISLTTFALTGVDAGNYDVTLPTLMANIFPAIYRTVGNVTFGNASNWESSPDGSTWNTATYYPDATPNTANITIRNTHTATLGANLSLDEVLVENGATLQISTGNVLTIGSDLSVTGGVLELQGTSTITGTGSFSITTSSTLKIAHATGFQAVGVSGSKNFQAGVNYEFNGSTLQTINNPTGISANSLTINNSAGATLSNDLTVTSTLTLTTGDLDLNGKNIDLGAGGILAESRANNHLVKDLTATNDFNQGGAILFTADVDNTTAEIRGTGLYLRSGSTNYTVTVARRHYNGAQASRGGYGIRRIYAITGTPVSSAMRIYYASEETTGVVAPYELYRWASGIGWQDGAASSVFDEGTHGSDYVEALNVTAFSHWTVGSQAQPLPITLVRFGGERGEKGGEKTEEVRLEWATASEINNKGFEVEMSNNGLAYEKIAFVEGKGNSTTIQPYNHTTIQPYDSYYRLKQVDFDGTFSYSPIVFVEGLVGKVVVYPNPNNGTFTVSVGKDKLDSPTRLLNAQGQEVWRGMQTEVVTTNLPTGVYFLHTTVAGKTKITKVIIEK